MTPARDERRPVALPVLTVVAAVLGGLGIGRLVVFDTELLHLSITPSLESFALIAVALSTCAALVRFPSVGFALLVGFVYLNLSQVLVRYHGLPSFLQLIALPLMIAAALGARGEGHGHPLRSPLTSLLLGYVVLVGASTAIARDFELADERLVDVAKAFLIYGLAASLATTRARLRTGVWMLLACGSLLAVVNIPQATSAAQADAFGGLARIKLAHIYGRVFEPRIAGPLGDPNYFAQILIILIPLSLAIGWHAGSRRTKLLAYAATGVIATAALLTYSRGGALALTLVVGLSILARGLDPRRLIPAVAVALVLAVTLVPDEFTRRLKTLGQLIPGSEEVVHPDSSFEKRKLFGLVAWRMFLDHPLLGVGAGNYNAHYDGYADELGSAARQYVDPDGRRYPHNLYLEIAAENGLAGLSLFVAAMVAAFVQLGDAQRRFAARGYSSSAALAQAFSIALAGYLLSSLFLHGDFQRYLWLLLAFASAVPYVASMERRGMRAAPSEA